ncbi:Neutral ceramidase [Ceratocystis fimbriata CBS 114723]|uniref:Neutral ceramidase n=1 Tax=Ceratocystis fimbriata CBS 114723 TaxID=1035309 RepID=A0A2C5X9P5_9PEZI|nr:Neutral ceramidase [Ceratocystis fimbriata CBS 114723]
MALLSATGQRPHTLFSGLSLALLLISLLISPIAAFSIPRNTDYNYGTGDKYLIGAGRGDITGPVVEINMAGYADLAQAGTGLRQRIYSRAFIFGDVSKPEDRVVYVVLDTQSGDTAIRNGILEGLAKLGDEYKVYSRHNVAITSTHSHSGVGGYYNYLLPQVTSLGFEKQNYQAIVDGAVLSIKRAHESLTTGYLDMATTEIEEGGINRSLWSYMHNPKEEQDLYNSPVEKTMWVLRLTRESDRKSLGVVSWYATHGTSLLQNNTHIAGDNKGVAAYLFEKDMENDENAAEGFVAAFSQSAMGDISPNTLGSWCDDGSGQQCSFENSTCSDGRSQSCRSRGPMFDKLDLGVSSCFEIGRRQFAGAKAAWDSMTTSSTKIVGSTVKAYHFFHDMRYAEFTNQKGEIVKTCPGALGYSFAAGTTDGPGFADFTQNDSGEPDANPFWKIVSGALKNPSDEQRKCQEPKPILLDIGEIDFPYAWGANLIDMQSLRVGQLIIMVGSGEITTMSGRRWRKAVAEAAAKQDITQGVEPIVLNSGPSNTYSHYVTTPEEYDVQRYEGASTLFGRNTLDAYINLTLSSLHYLAPDSTDLPESGKLPPDNRDNSLSLTSGVVRDDEPKDTSFGDCLIQPQIKISPGGVVNATFVAANPRNNLRLEGTFAAVEMKQGNTWTQVRSDYDWHLVYSWKRTNTLLGHSKVVITWEVEEDTAPGTYRLVYYGDSKGLFSDDTTPFEGRSDEFQVAL